jgi:hypothetical protein
MMLMLFRMREVIRGVVSLSTRRCSRTEIASRTDAGTNYPALSVLIRLFFGAMPFAVIQDSLSSTSAIAYITFLKTVRGDVSEQRSSGYTLTTCKTKTSSA